MVIGQEVSHFGTRAETVQCFRHSLDCLSWCNASKNSLCVGSFEKERASTSNVCFFSLGQRPWEFCAEKQAWFWQKLMAVLKNASINSFPTFSTTMASLLVFVSRPIHGSENENDDYTFWKWPRAEAKFVSTSFSALAPFIDISMTGQWDIEMQVERERWTFNSHDTLIAVFIMLEKNQSRPLLLLAFTSISKVKSYSFTRIPNQLLLIS